MRSGVDRVVNVGERCRPAFAPARACCTAEGFGTRESARLALLGRAPLRGGVETVITGVDNGRLQGGLAPTQWGAAEVPIAKEVAWLHEARARPFIVAEEGLLANGVPGWLSCGRTRAGAEGVPEKMRCSDRTLPSDLEQLKPVFCGSSRDGLGKLA